MLRCQVLQQISNILRLRYKVTPTLFRVSQLHLCLHKFLDRDSFWHLQVSPLYHYNLKGLIALNRAYLHSLMLRYRKHVDPIV